MAPCRAASSFHNCGHGGPISLRGMHRRLLLFIRSSRARLARSRGDLRISRHSLLNRIPRSLLGSMCRRHRSEWLRVLSCLPWRCNCTGWLALRRYRATHQRRLLTSTLVVGVWQRRDRLRRDGVPTSRIAFPGSVTLDYHSSEHLLTSDNPTICVDQWSLFGACIRRGCAHVREQFLRAR
eukprot:SAG31_NODE_3804_length_3866_cov_3.183435_4_plen_181_part_00